MTTVMVWNGRDAHGITSLYFATDSRSTIINGQCKSYNDTTRKCYYSNETPDIFAVYGCINNADEIINYLLKGIKAKRDGATSQGVEYTKHVFSGMQLRAQSEKLNILHGYRFDSLNFGLTHVVIGNSISYTELDLTPCSANSRYYGSGSDDLIEIKKEDFESFNRSNSWTRWCWQLFCDIFKPENKKDEFTGGFPQLVGLFRKYNGIQHGIYINNEMKFADGVETDFIFEYRDELFQRVDKNGNLLKSAQKHTRLTK